MFPHWNGSPSKSREFFYITLDSIVWNSWYGIYLTIMCNPVYCLRVTLLIYNYQLSEYHRKEIKKKKVKGSHYKPDVAQRVGRGTALLFHDHGTRRGWVVSSMPRPHFTPGKGPVPILQEAGWAPWLDWTGKKNLVPTGIRSRAVQPIVSRYTAWTTRPTEGNKW